MGGVTKRPTKVGRGLPKIVEISISGQPKI